MGRRPLSGDYRGVAEITELLRVTDEVGGEHSFTVTNVMSDDTGAQVLIEGVVKHGPSRRAAHRRQWEQEVRQERDGSSGRHLWWRRRG